MERSEIKQSQPWRLLPFARNDCKYFCPITYTDEIFLRWLILRRIEFCKHKAQTAPTKIKWESYTIINYNPLSFLNTFLTTQFLVN
ncbi:MAG: hypothetical protein AN486_00985 [Anabaena sp. AL93]|nr:MAG: hypothetical protein AN486_00985 [Anabaena sp. AL93]